jgi:hypothetical protein
MSAAETAGATKTAGNTEPGMALAHPGFGA